MTDCPRIGSIDLSCLTERQREVVEMHYESCLSFGAIAILLGVSVSSVKVHHRRALAKLADHVTQPTAVSSGHRR